MSEYKNKSRRLARRRYWDEHDRENYTCPDCGRGKNKITGSFEVHHQDGVAYDNRMENLVALCTFCHCLRENRKPPLETIQNFREQAKTDSINENEPDMVNLRVLEYINDNIGLNPKNSNWVNPFDLYWDDFKQKYPDVDINAQDFADALENKDECSVVIADHGNGVGVEVVGVEFKP